MTTTEKSLHEALIELDSAVRNVRTANPKPSLLQIFARIDDLTDQLPNDVDPRLLHFLRKKSYEKARLWLEGRDAENEVGSCRRD